MRRHKDMPDTWSGRTDPTGDLRRAMKTILHHVAGAVVGPESSRELEFAKVTLRQAEKDDSWVVYVP